MVCSFTPLPALHVQCWVHTWLITWGGGGCATSVFIARNSWLLRLQQQHHGASSAVETSPGWTLLFWLSPQTEKKNGSCLDLSVRNDDASNRLTTHFSKRMKNDPVLASQLQMSEEPRDSVAACRSTRAPSLLVLSRWVSVWQPSILFAWRRGREGQQKLNNLF